MAKLEVDKGGERQKDSRLHPRQQIVGEVERLETRKPVEREVGEAGDGVVAEVEAGQPVLEPEGQLIDLSYLVARHVEGDQQFIVKELGGSEEGDGGACY